MEDIKKRLTYSLLQMLDLEVAAVLKQFLEGETSVLFLLFRTGKPHSPSEIVNELSISKGRVTTLLNSLYEKGLIDIKMSEDDRRSFNVSITKKGIAVLLEKIEAADKYFDKLVLRLGEEKSNTLIEILNETVEIMKEDD